MRQKILWADLAICSLWVLVILSNRFWWYVLPNQIMALLLVTTRIVFAFLFYYKEKRAWIPLALFIGVSILLGSAGGDLCITKIIDLSFPMLGLEFDATAYKVLCVIVAAWLWVIPPIIYLVALCRKKLTRTNASWKDTFGAILWNDNGARVYSILMLVLIGTLYTGLAMNSRICLFVCLSAPTLCYWVIAKYYGVSVNRLWLMLVGMGVFFFAQFTFGLWRIGMLATSVIIVAYLCSRFYREKKLLSLSIAATVYIGVLLPSLAIGNNQYACIDYGRDCFNTLKPYSGIFHIKDSKSGGIGLRDRYGILVKPEYEQLAYHDKRHWFGKLELRKNGCYTLYDICNNSFSRDNAIRHELQNSVCRIIDSHFKTFAYEFDERLEVMVKDYATGKIISHVKASTNNTTIYDYNSEPYIKAEPIAVQSEVFLVDTVCINDYVKQTNSYSHDVKRDSVPMYNIFIQAARRELPQKAELLDLTGKIKTKLTQSKTNAVESGKSKNG